MEISQSRNSAVKFWLNIDQHKSTAGILIDPHKTNARKPF